MPARKFVVGKVDELKDGEGMVVTVNDRSIGVFHVHGEFYGLVNRCPHKGGELCKGRLVGNLMSDGPGRFSYDASTKLLMCPWHGWEFDVRTGQSYLDPTTVRVRPYQVQVEEGQLVMNEVDAGQVGVSAADRRPIEQGILPHPVVPGRLPGPYQAETIPITVEDEYIVVNLDPVRPPRRAKPAEEKSA
jgi:3-phenylpropionate/trans-cinnamate dioxygenase ferredoxin subunit